VVRLKRQDSSDYRSTSPASVMYPTEDVGLVAIGSVGTSEILKLVP